MFCRDAPAFQAQLAPGPGIGRDIELHRTVGGRRRDRSAEGDPIMNGIRTQLTEMLTKLSEESPKVLNLN